MSEILRLIVGENCEVRIPKRGVNVDILDKLGFKNIKDSDSWYYSAELPYGWGVISVHMIYGDDYYIVDKDGNKRIQILMELTEENEVRFEETQVYTWFKLKTESESNGTTVFVSARNEAELQIPICKCEHVISTKEERDSCLYAAKRRLEEEFPGCSDVRRWDNNPLEELIAIYKEFKSKTN